MTRTRALILASLSALALALVALYFFLTRPQIDSVNMERLRNGMREAVVRHTRQVSGGTITRTTSMHIDQAGRSGGYETKSVFDSEGMPKFEEGVITADEVKATISYEFSSHGANMTIATKGKSATQPLLLPYKSPLKNPSVWWFVPGRPLPKVGESCTCQSPDPATRKWHETTTTYVGREQITIGAKTYNAHKVIYKSAGPQQYTRWVDERGMPLKTEQGQTTSVRI